ncbi:MAG: heavy-metal-associated domain-containing protein [Cytophagaceae bacterium]
MQTKNEIRIFARRWTKCLLILLCFVLSGESYAQISQVWIGIDGLTCSLCSNTVDKSLNNLSFVKEVKMDLNENVAKVLLKEGKVADLNMLAQKVKDAGYSVRFLDIDCHFDSLSIDENSTFDFDGKKFVLIDSDKRILNGEIRLKLLGKNFFSRKEYPKWSQKLRSSIKSKDLYFVTIENF